MCVGKPVQRRDNRDNADIRHLPQGAGRVEEEGHDFLNDVQVVHTNHDIPVLVKDGLYGCVGATNEHADAVNDEKLGVIDAESLRLEDVDDSTTRSPHLREYRQQL